MLAASELGLVSKVYLEIYLVPGPATKTWFQFEYADDASWKKPRLMASSKNCFGKKNRVPSNPKKPGAE